MIFAHNNVRPHGLPERMQGLPEAAPRLIVIPITPKQRREVFAAVRLAGQHQIDQQCLCFLGTQIDGLAIAGKGKFVLKDEFQGQFLWPLLDATKDLRSLSDI